MAFWDYFFKKKSESASHAVDRIKFVLQSDRTGLPPETLERIKNDIISVLSKYVDIETAELDFNITKAPTESGAMTPALCANIPIKGVKRNAPAPEPKKTEASSDAAGSKSSSSTTEVKKESESAEKDKNDKIADNIKNSGEKAGETAVKAAVDIAKTAGNADKTAEDVTKTAGSTVKATENVSKTAETAVKTVENAVKSADTSLNKAEDKAKASVDENPELGSALDITFKRNSTDKKA